jgi:hypothetical protein
MMTEQFPPRPAPAPTQPLAGPAQAFPSLAQPFAGLAEQRLAGMAQAQAMQNPYTTPEFAQRMAEQLKARLAQGPAQPMQNPYTTPEFAQQMAEKLQARLAQGPAQPIPAEEMSQLRAALGQPPALGQGPMQMSPGMGQPMSLLPEQLQRISQLSAVGGGIGALYRSTTGQPQPPMYGPSQQSPFEPLQQPPLGQGPMPAMSGQPQRPPLGQGPMQSPFGQSPMQSQQSAFGKGIPQMPSSFGQPQQSAFGQNPMQSQQSAFGQSPMQSQQSAFGQSPMQSQQASNQSGGGGRLF